MNDLLKNYKSNVAAKKTKTFKLKFKQIAIIGILSRENVPNFHSSNVLVRSTHRKLRLVIKVLNFRLLLLKRIKVLVGIISLNLGVRTFIIGYNPSDKFIE